MRDFGGILVQTSKSLENPSRIPLEEGFMRDFGGILPQTYKSLENLSEIPLEGGIYEGLMRDFANLRCLLQAKHSFLAILRPFLAILSLF